MPSTLTSTGVTFSDGTSQNTAAGGGVTKTKQVLYKAAATHTISSNTEYLEIHALGGGGAHVGGGGGGGGYAGAIIEKAVSIPNVNSLAVTVGAGGSQPINFPYIGTAGGQSSVGGYVVANGGNNGTDATNSTSGGSGGTGAVNFSSPIQSATGTGGNGGGGSWNSNSSGIRGNPPSGYGGGGGGRSKTTNGSGSNTFVPFPIQRPGYRYDINPFINKSGTNPNTYDFSGRSPAEMPDRGSGGNHPNNTTRGGDGAVFIIEYGSN